MFNLGRQDRDAGHETNVIPRKQYGALNYSEGGYDHDPFAADEKAMGSPAAAESFNTGKVYVNTRRQVGGVSPGDNGMMPTRNMWYGVIGAILRPVGLTQGQTMLFQDAANPVGWAGDTPIDLQPATTRAAPWRRQALSPVRVTQ